MKPDKISIIIPMLNEASEIVGTLKSLQLYRQQGHEVIVVDGGSHDGCVELAVPWADRVLTAQCASERGRSIQMNRGAAVANGKLLLFLHGDTRLPAGAIDRLVDLVVAKKQVWGRFDLTLSGQKPLFRLVERLINWRSRLTSIATGDQAIFVSRCLFDRVGAYRVMPLMEDIDLSSRLKRHVKPINLSIKVVSSSRRWEERGIVRTILLMWALRFAYALGVQPSVLARYYRYR